MKAESVSRRVQSAPRRRHHRGHPPVWRLRAQDSARRLPPLPSAPRHRGHTLATECERTRRWRSLWRPSAFPHAGTTGRAMQFLLQQLSLVLVENVGNLLGQAAQRESFLRVPDATGQGRVAGRKLLGLQLDQAAPRQARGRRILLPSEISSLSSGSTRTPTRRRSSISVLAASGTPSPARAVKTIT